MENALGSEHHEFLQWAASEGIVVQGVAPAKFPGRGLGMVATRTIQVSQSSPCNHNTKKKKKKMQVDISLIIIQRKGKRARRDGSRIDDADD